MDGGIEAAGDAATGSLIARTVEPATGIARHGADGRDCLNCGTARLGAFCHRCGQGDHVHRSMGAIGHDLLHGVFHFEGKIFRTLPMLVLRPGELTRRYIAGERARFVSPLALFLFTVFLMFAIYSAVGPKEFGAGLVDGLAGTRAGLETGRNEALAALTRLERQRAAPTRSSTERAAIDRKITAQRRALREIAAVQRQIDTNDGKQMQTGWPWLDKAIHKVRTNPSLVAYKVQSSAYKYSWALIILSVPLVAMLFLWRRGYALYDHAVFVTYSIAFMSLLTIGMELWLTLDLSRTLFWLIVAIVPPVHMFAQLRGAYRLRRRSALWRTVVLVLIAFMVIMLFVVSLLAMGASG